MSRAFVLLLILGCCTSCTSITVRKLPTVDLSRYHRIFVIQPFNENHHVDEFFAAELRAKGLVAASGPLTMMPEDTDAVLAYDTRWTWDFKTYMIELDASLRTAHTDKLLAQARYYQPSARPRAPDVVVHDIVQRLFPN